MAEDINKLIPKDAIASIIKLNESIIKLDETYMKLIKDIQSGQEVLKTQKTTFKELGEHQKTIKKTTEQLTTAEKEQKKAAESLAKQRQRGLAAMAKQEAKEKALIEAATKEIKSVDDLKARIKALTALRNRLDKSTTEGKKNFDKLTQSIKKNRQELKSTSTATGGLAAAFQKSFLKIGVAVAAVVGIYKKFSGFITDSIEKFDQQQLAEVALSTALGKTSKALLNQASAFQKLTRFGDEEIIRGQAFLAQMGLTEKQIERIVPRILDFAQAKGIDLKIAADLVAKSIGSETNALSRYGIQIEGAAGSQERLESAFSALDDKFKGQAEAALTGAGALKQLSNTWGDLKERVGGFIAKAINPFIRSLNEALTVTESQSLALIQEKNELNVLVGAITNVNTEQEARNRLITELEQKYPNFLENLDTENVDNKTLKDRLTDVNDQYERRISLIIAQELQAEAAKELAESYKSELQQLKLIAFLEKEIAEGRAFTEGDVLTQVDRNQQLEIAVTNLGKIKDEQLAINTATQETIRLATEATELLGQQEFFTGAGVDELTEDEKLKNIASITGISITEEDLEVVRRQLKKLDVIIKEQREQQKLENEIFTLEEEENVKDESEKLAEIYKQNAENFTALEEEKRRQKLATLGVIADGFGRETLIGKAALAMQRANAIKQSLISLGIINAKNAEAQAKSAAAAPFPFNIPLILGAIAQFASIIQLFTKAKKFKHGTHGKHDTPDTFITSEPGAGVEGIETNGLLTITDKPTLHTGKKGSRVYSESELKRYPNKAIQSLTKNAGYDSIDLRGVIESNKEIVKAIKNQKQYIVNNGKITGFKQSNYKRTYIDRMTNNGN
jgi:hypothetical protein